MKISENFFIQIQNLCGYAIIFMLKVVMHSNLFVGLLDVMRLQCGAFQMLQNTDAQL